ncbi:MAG: sodium:solute symporter [Acidobacteria bacterium]|nr:sodium:solute symporter [Acidobacteriota bacterium]
MKLFDWVVLLLALGGVIFYGLWKARGSNTTDSYLRAGRTMPWYAMALSIMATQASAITFISTTGQAYVDGMRFVQFYLGLPIAMVILSVTAVPVFHRANVYTAYEYLEQRFDSKVRLLVSILFLIQRGLAVGLALSAPAIVLTVILGWSAEATTIVMGVTVVLYTALGGVKAITWTDFYQMLIMMFGLGIALVTAIWLLPADVGFLGALEVAGGAGKINPIVTAFSWNDRYNLWSGIFGGMFLALSYFGCDQSQVQRYLTGSSITQSRLSLLFNGLAKLPMQFVILLTGCVVFAFFTYTQPPLLFQKHAQSQIEKAAEYPELKARYDAAFAKRRAAAGNIAQDKAAYQAAAAEFDAVRKQGSQLAERVLGEKGFNDTNYIFLNFVTTYLPAGLVGLVIAAILAAAMSTISGEINSLATVSIIDVYRRYVNQNADDRHYLWAARIATTFWGIYAVVTAQFARNMGSLVEAVNLLGSLFYGGILGVFVLAMYTKRVGPWAAFLGVIAGETAIFALHFSGMTSFLWYNVIGCLVVIAVGLGLSFVEKKKPA